ncbi:hypothetical protein F0562_028900 [Nyssa sinensis]|uniref:Uncharacterized protein n=1 Tax=Nyssa sinensis TaxID=561372 RepID=A0A5J5B3H4_9ASTE|nr:hypothetical protein F0562_028900 [Nyssa sinensis]
MHRAVVNNKATRISIAIANGPSLDTIVSPLVELVNSESHPTVYIPMKYKEYLEIQETKKIDGKSSLDHTIKDFSILVQLILIKHLKLLLHHGQRYQRTVHFMRHTHGAIHHQFE